MSCEINIVQLRAVCRTARAPVLDAVLAPLNAACAEFEINTPLRVRHFLAQIAHESAEFRYLRELADGHAYEGRADLGNTEPGDGVRFKGWGYMETTGRKNTLIVSLALFGDDRLVRDPTLINPPGIELAMRSAGHFWTTGAGLNLSKRAIAFGVPEGVNLNDLADKNDAFRITLAVNGADNGLASRYAYLGHGVAAFPDEVVA
jgi:putative chitinase